MSGPVQPDVSRLKTWVEPVDFFGALPPVRRRLLLLSGPPHDAGPGDNGGVSRYSFILNGITAEVKGDRNRFLIDAGGELKEHHDAPYARLAEWFRSLPTLAPVPETPFPAGLAGYFSYEARHYFERLPVGAVRDQPQPFFRFFLTPSVITFDHAAREVTVTRTSLPAVDGNEPLTLEEILRVIECAEKSGGLSGGCSKRRGAIERTPPVRMLPKTQYLECIKRIKHLIREGDVYEVNFTHRFQGAPPDDPARLFLRLAAGNPAPFAAFIDFGDTSIISSSPERFLRLAAGRAQARPIKGTRPRGDSVETDDRLARELVRSEKDRAENLMAVDILRNDLGKICRFGTVNVPALFQVEKHPTVIHLVSVVEGILRENADIFDLIAASFPGGSMTGAPKIRVMEVIDELEPVSREIYSGSLGYISLTGDADLNIVIRSMIISNSLLTFHVGGGIVADSDPEMEFEESLHKAAALLEACRG